MGDIPNKYFVDTSSLINQASLRMREKGGIAFVYRRTRALPIRRRGIQIVSFY